MPVTRTFSRARAAVVLGIFGMVAGAGLLVAGSALAGVGAEPGDLTLSASTGALMSTPTWSTTTACPSGYQDSAEMEEFSLTGTKVSLISPAVNSGLTAPFSGTLDGNVGALLNVAGVNATTPGTVEWAIGCWNGPGGTGTGCAPVEYEQSIFVSVAADATTYTTSASAPAGSPTATTSTSSCTPSSTESTTSAPTVSTSTPTVTSTSSSSVNSSATSAPTSTSASSGAPSGAPQTGAGGASGSGPNTLLISLGATALVGSAAATSVAILRRRRWSPGEDPQDQAEPGGS